MVTMPQIFIFLDFQIFGVEYIPKEIKSFMRSKNMATRIVDYNSVI